MSDLALTTPYSRETVGLGACLRALFARKPARPAALLLSELQALDPHLLADIGVDAREVPRTAADEASRLCLIERGWSPVWPRRSI